MLTLSAPTLRMNCCPTLPNTHVHAHVHFSITRRRCPLIDSSSNECLSSPPSKWAVKLHPEDRLAPSPLAEEIYLFVCLFAWFKYLVGEKY